MAGNLAQTLEPIREKRKYYESQPNLVHEIIKTGTDKARKTAQQTMKEVRSAMKMY
jgi:tryptophanyl-tRNA synthetase